MYYMPLLLNELPSFSALSSQLVPAVLLALLLDSGIMAAWYLIGVALNSAEIKGGAAAEFYQLVGTAILISIISGILIIYGRQSKQSFCCRFLYRVYVKP